jgi:hypothetical protein
MAGNLTPLVMLPRYTTYVGASTFTTIGMEVTDYSKAIVNVWRGQLVGTTPTIGFSFQESTDQINWTDCTGVTSPVDPGADTEDQYQPVLNKRWFRIKVELGGTDPSGTCWAIGFLEMRES